MSSAGKTAGAGNPVIRNCAQCLVHVPDLVPYGSKPRREILKDPTTGTHLAKASRSFAKAVAYPPNQTFITQRDDPPFALEGLRADRPFRQSPTNVN